MQRLACLLLVLVPACVGPVVQEAPVHSHTVEAVVHRIAETFADLTTGGPAITANARPVHIGVVDFESSTGATLLGETLAHDLSGALAAELRRRNASSTRVVTRHHLYEVVQEQDLFDRGPETIGRIVGADLLIMGRITAYREDVHVSAQLLDVADGVVLGAAQEELRRTHHVEALLVPPHAPVLTNSSSPAAVDHAVTRSTSKATPRVLLGMPGADDSLGYVAVPAVFGLLPDVPDHTPALPVAAFVGGESSFSRTRRLRFESSEKAARQQPSVLQQAEVDSGLAFIVETEPVRLVAGTGDGSLLPRVTIVARLDAGGGRNVDGRRPAHICLAVDMSGSMDGGRLDDAVLAIEETIKVLGPRDWISIVGFSDTAYPLVAPVRATEQAKVSLLRRMSRLSPGGNTDFEAALEEISRCLRVTRNEDLAHHAVLISDGRPTAGSRNTSTLGQLAQRLSASGCLDTIGVGDDYGRDTLRTLAREGNGQFHVIERPGDLAGVVVKRVREATAVPTVRASLTFTPAPQTAIVGSADPWDVSLAGSWNADLGVLSSPAVIERRLEVHPSLPPRGQRAVLGEITLTWVDEHDSVQTRSQTVSVDVVHASPLVSDA